MPGGRYPFSATGLPQGVATFLNRVDATGNVLNPSGSGGYLRWTLYPKYRILMDMESFFTDEDFYVGRYAFLDPEVLNRILVRYEPSFITVPLGITTFRALIRQFPDYVPVFVDDAEVLYVNRTHYPDLAQRYQLTALDPFQLFTDDLDEMTSDPARNQLFMEEIRRLLAVYPEGGNTNHVVGWILNRESAYDRALPHAEVMIRSFPEFPQGYVLKGHSLRGLGLQDQAYEAYRLALKHADSAQRGPIYKLMGTVRLSQHRYGEAYRLLVKGVDVLSPVTSREDLLALGVAAAQAGRMKEAEAIFVHLLRSRVPLGDTVWRARVGEALGPLKMRDVLGMIGDADASVTQGDETMRRK
jgi:tetratricopeptide (TPR) repeat protein